MIHLRSHGQREADLELGPIGSNLHSVACHHLLTSFTEGWQPLHVMPWSQFSLRTYHLKTSTLPQGASSFFPEMTLF